MHCVRFNLLVDQLRRACACLQFHNVLFIYVSLLFNLSGLPFSPEMPNSLTSYCVMSHVFTHEDTLSDGLQE